MSNVAGVLMWQVFLWVFLWVMSEAVYQYSVESEVTLKFSYLQLKSFCIFKYRYWRGIGSVCLKIAFLKFDRVTGARFTQDHAMDQNPMLELTDLWC